MKKKGLVLIAIAFVLVVAGFVLMHQKAEAPARALEAQTATTTAETTAARTFSWRFETTESEDGLPPRTMVALYTGDEAYDAGAYAGSCSEIAAENLLPGEVSGVLCWYAGGGDEVGVFRDEDNNYFLLHGFQEEGTAETDGFRGDFKEIASLD